MKRPVNIEKSLEDARLKVLTAPDEVRRKLWQRIVDGWEEVVRISRRPS
jgi:hypothetical protein